ncbi:MAG: hypothetical protein HKO59_04345 [Phycisphaerales bacterium]|nr:hypothetical protein [Phycisphaerae bacterium]NNF42133.1 hypothetical protein [Phycisphaerales bacterium]NNM25206.1 hypothetical protein [Phycisphaerales bacterium]
MNIRSLLLLPLTIFALAAGCASSSSPVASDDLPASGVLPPPYTAAELRAANPAGTRLAFRLEPVGAAAVEQVIEFVSVDRDHAMMQSHARDAAGVMTGSVERSQATWSELRDHAAFSAERARRVRAVRPTPFGALPGWEYTVEEEPIEGLAVVSTYHFADGRPGPPVAMEVRHGDAVTLRMTMIADSRATVAGR